MNYQVEDIKDGEHETIVSEVPDLDEAFKIASKFLAKNPKPRTNDQVIIREQSGKRRIVVSFLAFKKSWKVEKILHYIEDAEEIGAAEEQW